MAEEVGNFNMGKGARFSVCFSGSESGSFDEVPSLIVRQVFEVQKMGTGAD
ncbi:hypothetical protein HGG75_27965 [Ochrobactrum pseudogrignonense]|nr:hypothetical protein [Brucella pseudogrignonensis]